MFGLRYCAAIPVGAPRSDQLSSRRAVAVTSGSGALIVESSL